MAAKMQNKPVPRKNQKIRMFENAPAIYNSAMPLANENKENSTKASFMALGCISPA